MLSSGVMFSTAVKAQRVNTFTVEQQTRIDSLKQGYIAQGVPAHWAEKRATMIVEQESKARLRSTTRLATPHPGSILVDRGTAPGGYSAQHAYTPAQLITNVLLNNPAAASAISNVQFTGTWTTTQRSLAYFEAGSSGFPIEKGLILATGDVLGSSYSAEGPNNQTGGLNNGNTAVGSDPDLSALTISTVTCGSILSFDFKPFKPDVTFDFIFASTEYPEYTGSSYNDVFGFFVQELPSGPKQNIAYFSNGTTPVTINNSNWGNPGLPNVPSSFPGNHALPGSPHPEWHIPVFDGDDKMEYDGHTVMLTAKALGLSTSKTYRLELKIANVGDQALGSAVFLSNLDLGAPEVGLDTPYMGAWNPEWDEQGKDHLYADCIQTLKLSFLPAAFDRKLVLSYMGIASKENIRKADGSPLPDTLDLKANEELITFPIKILPVPAADNGKEGAIKVCIVGGDCDTVMNKSTKHFFKFYNGVQTNIDST